MRIAECVLIFLLLGGCTGVNETLNEESGAPEAEVQMPDDRYRIFDQPAASKMTLTSVLARTVEQRSELLFAIDKTPSKQHFDAAAQQYLNETGRASCRVVDSYPVVKSQFDVKYDCTPPPNPRASSLPGRRARISKLPDSRNIRRSRAREGM